MGLDRFQKTPCGFCFVEYATHQEAVNCMRFVNGTKLDERVVRTDLDPGFKEGRQYGRGRSGGQVDMRIECCSDEFRFEMNTAKTTTRLEEVGAGLRNNNKEENRSMISKSHTQVFV